ncbi:MAG TPA: GxxExxY protein [bacterium]|nr:GxxExxY protein [bacterium]
MKQFDPIPQEIEDIAAQVIDACFRVHKNLGPGLLESVYEVCVCYELTKADIPFQSQIYLPVVYDGERLDAGLRIDLLVAEKVILELKAVERMIPLYDAQLLTYLKLTGLRLGFIINFNVPLIKDGIRRIIR